MSKKKVLITGIGMVTPIGLTREASWQAAKDGKSGVTAITRFDSSRRKKKKHRNKQNRGNNNQQNFNRGGNNRDNNETNA